MSITSISKEFKKILIFMYEVYIIHNLDEDVIANDNALLIPYKY